MKKTFDIDNILTKFNNRDVVAFGEIYSMFYDDLYYYSLKLYANIDVEPQDAVHDAFLKLWQMSNTNFDNLIDLKGYLFVIIRNEFNQYVRHNHYVELYKKQKLQDKRAFEFDVLESELRGRSEYILNLLPRDCAEVIRLFFEGLETEEIALKLGKTKQTIYNKKHEAVSILKKKLSKEDVALLILFLSQV